MGGLGNVGLVVSCHGSQGISSHFCNSFHSLSPNRRLFFHLSHFLLDDFIYRPTAKHVFQVVYLEMTWVCLVPFYQNDSDIFVSEI